MIQHPIRTMGLTVASQKPPCLLVDLASSKPHSMPFKVGCRFLKQPNRRCNGTVLSDRIFRTIESITLAEILANRTANSCPAPFRTAYGVAAGIEINASCAGQVERPEARELFRLAYKG